MFQLNCSSCMAFGEVGPCGIPLGPNITFDCCACSASIITTEYTGKFDNTSECYNSTACPCRWSGQSSHAAMVASRSAHTSASSTLDPTKDLSTSHPCINLQQPSNSSCTALISIPIQAAWDIAWSVAYQPMFPYWGPANPSKLYYPETRYQAATHLWIDPLIPWQQHLVRFYLPCTSCPLPFLLKSTFWQL